MDNEYEAIYDLSCWSWLISCRQDDCQIPHHEKARIPRWNNTYPMRPFVENEWLIFGLNVDQANFPTPLETQNVMMQVANWLPAARFEISSNFHFLYMLSRYQQFIDRTGLYSLFYFPSQSFLKLGGIFNWFYSIAIVEVLQESSTSQKNYPSTTKL